MTRVERVDDQPSHGEVPGTEAYSKRTQDAVPDEVEIVPEGGRSRSASRVGLADRPTSGTPPVPKTVVEKIDPDAPSHGDVPGTQAFDVRAADATPDVVVKAPEVSMTKLEGSPTNASSRSPLNHDREEVDEEMKSVFPRASDDAEATQAEEADDHDFGDDFDDFEEGGEGDDFGDFDDGFQADEQAESTFDQPTQTSPVPAPTPGHPVLRFADLDTLEDMKRATQPYIDDLYPGVREQMDGNTFSQGPQRSIFLSERSESLWAQLVATPPLQPPDWVRSRIRRLFLVSLGVPVDLDEILPASKQKKLVLPSIHIPGDRSPRPSGDGRNGTVERLKRENNSSTSLDSSASKPERKRKGAAPVPQLDVNSAKILCSTTDAALGNFTQEELEAHVQKLEELRTLANEVFTYWQKRMESALGDKDAFEQVIESLVAHAKKLR